MYLWLHPEDVKKNILFRKYYFYRVFQSSIRNSYGDQRGDDLISTKSLSQNVIVQM